MKVAVKQRRMNIRSKAFPPRTFIHPMYTRDGENINPPLTIGNIPPGIKSLAVIMEDPDAPGGKFVHWVTWNIPPLYEIAEDSSPGVQGKNDFGNLRYDGPAPPSGTHRYIFKVYALDTSLSLRAGATGAELEKAMAGHITGYGELLGLYASGSKE